MQDYIRINAIDNVAVALSPLSKGLIIKSSESGFPIDITISENIPQGHKFALTAINAGDRIIKYGSPIGVAVSNITSGSHVHVHNIKTLLNEKTEYKYEKTSTSPASRGTFIFNGFLRDNGKAGIRNDIWIIPTVGCVNGLVKALAKETQSLKCGSIDDICAFSHPYGCSQMGDDQENTRHILADLILHPNAGGVLVVGLGCENSGVSVIKEYLGDSYDRKRIRFLIAQDFTDELESGIEIIKEIAAEIKNDRRVPVSSQKLVVGLKCGGSDGLSGITANPAVGIFSDSLISRGGTAILTEVPEMFGAEGLLMNRCKDEAIYRQTVDLINNFKAYFKSYNQVIYENPSPGNKNGGISTLEDKSLGCTQKSGKADISGVIPYAGRAVNSGLNLLSAPGNDLVAATALAAAGAQLILFTTGRGTPFSAPVPTIKISTNTLLYDKKRNWIDFNCGVIVTEGKSIKDTADELSEFVISVCDGMHVKSEKAGYKDMAIFKNGVTC